MMSKLLMFVLVLNLIYLGRNFMTHYYMRLVTHAIRDFNIHEIYSITDVEELKNYKGKVEFTDMRKYISYMLDLTAWTPRSILSPEKYALIEPFIEKVK